MKEDTSYTGCKIFIVDDNPANTMMLKQVVEAEGFEFIYVYNDPELALQAFFIHRPDLVLLDLLMPKISGIEFLQRIEKEIDVAEVSVIVLTSCHDKEQKIEALAMGAQDYIEKPFNIIEILQRIKNVLHLQQRKNNFQNLSEQLDGQLNKSQKDLSGVLSTLNTVFDHSSEYVFVADGSGLIIDCNKMAQESFDIVRGEDTLFKRFRINEQLLASQSKELILEGSRHTQIIVEASYSRVRVNQETHYVLIFKDITTHKEDEINLKYLAETHYITHLPNRNQLYRLVSEKCSQLNENHRLAFIFISFPDNSKVVELYGHARFEFLLLNIALILVELTTDCGAALLHWGDNDFLMVEESDKSHDLIEQIQQRFTESIQISEFAEIGIYSKPMLGACHSGKIADLDPEKYDSLVHNALLAAFEGIRNATELTLYDESLQQKINYQMMIEKELIKAIAGQSFKVAYQPKVNLKTGLTVGAEALLRWQHPEFGVIRPDIFIPIAESAGLITEIGAMVLTQVFADIPALRDKYPDIEHVSVNVAAQQIEPQLIRLLDSLLVKNGAQVSQFIELEITESSFLDDMERANIILAQLKQAGFSLAIDDFGTGYSSLSYLHELPMDTLKIDRAFIIPILTSERSLLLVKSIISMSLSLGLEIVAEGIEDLETGQLLSELGVQQGQGFYYCKPEFLA